MSKKTEQLIQELCEDATPVIPVRHPFTRWLVWFFGALAIGAVGIVYFNISPTLATAVSSSWFIFEAIMLGLGWVWTSGCLLRCSIPAEDTINRQYWALTPLLVYVALTFGYFLTHLVANGLDQTVLVPQWHCVRIILSIGLAPLVFLTLLTRKGAPLRIGYSGFLIALAGGLLGSFSLHFICPVRSGDHLFMSHAIPVLVMAGVGYLVVSRFIRRL